MKFKKTPLEEKKSVTPFVHSEPAIGEVVRPIPVTSKSESDKPAVPLKPIKVHTYNWVLLLLALVLTVIALLVFTGRGKPPQLATSEQNKARSFEGDSGEIIPEGDGGAFESFDSKIVPSSEESEEEYIPAKIQLSEPKVSFSATSLLDLPLEKNVFVSCAKGRFKILSIVLEPSIQGLSLNSKKCEEISIFKEKIDTCVLTLSWDYNKTD
ncbi:MAG: hypothetical protein JW812_01750, partial [Alphaproteobacteria bacterium]|nr:hypothetical protein [Alphaproteobacteria bacterium]